MPTYTRSDLKTRINAKIKGKIGILVSANDTMNEAVRQVLADVDLRSTRRRTALTPGLFNDIFEYSAPSDLKDYKIINIEPQTDRQRVEYNLVPYEEFMRRKDTNAIAIQDNDFIRKILVNARINDDEVIVSTLDSLTAGGGTWEGDPDSTTNLEVETQNYVRGSAAIKFDISAGESNGGIFNTAINTLDLTDFQDIGTFFFWIYLPNVSVVEELAFTWGSSSSNYYTVEAITTTAAGTALATGWNLIKANWSDAQTGGTPVVSAIDYIGVNISYDGTAQTGYIVDHIVLKKGEIHNVVYYSKYGWQSSAGTYKENSTADSDLLNADTTEFNLIVEKGAELAALEVDENDIANRSATAYQRMAGKYQRDNPSEAKYMTSTYMDFI